MDDGHRFKVKRICVKPGAKYSLQKHWHRSEHWVIVTGTALVTRDTEDLVCGKMRSTFIPAGTGSSPRQSGTCRAAHDRSAVRRICGRGRHRSRSPTTTDALRKMPKPVRNARFSRRRNRARPFLKVRVKTKLKLAKPHRKIRRKANPAAATRRRVARHPVRPPTRVTSARKLGSKPETAGKAAGKAAAPLAVMRQCSGICICSSR